MREKHADEYEVTDLNEKEDGKWKELELELVYFSYLNFKWKLAGIIEAMKQKSRQNMLQAKAGSKATWREDVKKK